MFGLESWHLQRRWVFVLYHGPRALNAGRESFWESFQTLDWNADSMRKEKQAAFQVKPTQFRSASRQSLEDINNMQSEVPALDTIIIYECEVFVQRMRVPNLLVTYWLPSSIGSLVWIPCGNILGICTPGYDVLKQIKSNSKQFFHSWISAISYQPCCTDIRLTDQYYGTWRCWAICFRLCTISARLPKIVAFGPVCSGRNTNLWNISTSWNQRCSFVGCLRIPFVLAAPSVKGFPICLRSKGFEDSMRWRHFKALVLVYWPIMRYWNCETCHRQQRE